MVEKKKSGKQRKGDLYSKEENGIIRKNKSCPKCGSGIFMAEHKDRRHCGKCGYTEWKK
jgi:small subunit ribosomal protein S27Ae